MKRIIKNTLFLVLLMALIPSLFLTDANGDITEQTLTRIRATEYYVHKDHPQASNNNDGTDINHPWKTIGKANQALLPGDTAHIREGVYQEAIDPHNSGSKGKKITYRAYPGEEVLLEGYPAKAYGDWFPQGLSATVYIGWTDWKPKSYIVVDGFTLKRSVPEEGTYAGKPVIVYSLNSIYNEVKNCRILGISGDKDWMICGICLNLASHCVVENNYIPDTHLGIILGRGTDNVIRNNQVINPYHNCITIGSDKGQMHNYLIEGNILCGSKVSDGIQFSRDYDIPYDDSSNRGVVVRNNIICYNAENALDLKGTAYVVIEGNIIYGNKGNNNGGDEPTGNNRLGGFGGIMHGSSTGSRDVIIRNNVLYDNLGGILVDGGYKVYNNTVVYNNRDYIGSNSDYFSIRKPTFVGLWSSKTQNTKTIIKNNIMGGHNHCEIMIMPDEWYDDPTNGRGMFIDNNLYFGKEGSQFVGWVKYNWVPLSFNKWLLFLNGNRGITGYDINSLETDPIFVNVPSDPYGSSSKYNFNVRQNSPCINRGVYLTKTVYQNFGTEILVEDAGYFFNGYNVVDGDLIKVGSNKPVMVTAIDYETGMITVDTSISWNMGDDVNLPYKGAGPNIGAIAPVPGDIDGDRKVNKTDLSIIKSLFGTTSSDSDWNEKANFVKASDPANDVIDIGDLLVVVSHLDIQTDFWPFHDLRLLDIIDPH